MIPLPKNLEVTFLAEKKELACTSLSQVLFPSGLEPSISDQIWLQMENRVFTKNMILTWFLHIKPHFLTKTS